MNAPAAAKPFGATEVLREPDASEVARAAAARIALLLADAIAARGGATIALSGGNTPRDTYARLARADGIDWSKVDLFWVDERAVPPDHDRSNYRAAKATLLDAARIPDRQVHRLRADAVDRDVAAREYEALLRRHVGGQSGAPSFDVVVLGMGDDGHTASLFPREPTVEISDRLVVAVPPSGAREARLTLTAPVIQSARSVLVLVVGPEKRVALARAWAPDGDVRETPVRLVGSCRGAVTWIVDRAAAG